MAEELLAGEQEPLRAQVALLEPSLTFSDQYALYSECLWSERNLTSRARTCHHWYK